MMHASHRFSATFGRRLLRQGFAVSLCAVLTLCACGKTGDPVAPDDTRGFAWEKVEAQMAGACIAFSGAFSGAFENFDGIRVEIDPVNGPEDCPGCPFVPSEVTELSPRKVGFDAKQGTVAFNYCPQPAQAYRWRLAGISRYNRLPHAVMREQTLVVRQSAAVKAAPASSAATQGKEAKPQRKTTRIR